MSEVEFEGDQFRTSYAMPVTQSFRPASSENPRKRRIQVIVIIAALAIAAGVWAYGQLFQGPPKPSSMVIPDVRQPGQLGQP